MAEEGHQRVLPFLRRDPCVLRAFIFQQLKREIVSSQRVKAPFRARETELLLFKSQIV
jgi:hypothetical protein